ncbi:MAG: ABC transporter ATP-binding protein [Acidimicrobiales bacterium]
MTPPPVQAPLLRFDQVVKRFVGTSPPAGVAALPGRGIGLGPAALDGVTFDAHPGEVVGLIGRNGSGKTTTLKLAAGILEPTSGTTTIIGSPAPMIELGFPFHRDLTGWENLRPTAALLGYPADTLDEQLEAVVEFSGIRRHLDLPVKHFSTGMISRLGFALATHGPCDVLLIDEVLSVGDREFQLRCIDRVRDLVGGGATALFVSHSMELVHQVCDRVLLLERGRVAAEGLPREVIGSYDRTARHAGRRGELPGTIDAFEVDQGTIASGDLVRVSATVTIKDPSAPLRLQAEFRDPAAEAGFVSLPSEPAGGWRPGTSRVHGTVGPISATAGTLEVAASLVAPAGHDHVIVFDRAAAPITVEGIDLGIVRIAMDGSWSAAGARPTEPPSRSRPDRAGDRIRCVAACKRFASLPAWADHASRRGPTADALVDIDLAVDRGEAVGLIGPNGAGKTTLLRLLAGIAAPTSGTVEVTGSRGALLELDLGFHGELTARENLRFLWELNGGDPRRTRSALGAIEGFADIGDHLDVPAKHLSTGMVARLSTSTILELAPDVLLIDEALSVGDIDFRERTRARLLDLIDHGTTVVFASHDLHLVTSVCDRVVRLLDGRVADDGPALEVIADSGGIGWSGGATVAAGTLAVRDLDVAPALLEWGEPFEVSFELEVLAPTSDAYLEFSIRHSLEPSVRDRPQEYTDRLAWTEHLQVIDLPDDVLRTPGTHRVRGELAGIGLLSLHDVVVTVVDAIDGTIISEQWRTVHFGSEGTTAARLSAHWAYDPDGT